MPLSILITGGSGLMGTHLVDALVSRGDRVTVIDITPPRKEQGGVTYIQRDIRDERLAECFIDAHPNAVIHLAAHKESAASVREPTENADHNIIGTLNVLDAARVAGAKRVVFASSGAVYGEQNIFPIPENAICRPCTPHGVSKLTAERYLRYFTLQCGLSGCALRLADASQDPANVSDIVEALLLTLEGNEEAPINIGLGTVLSSQRAKSVLGWTPQKEI